MSELRTIKAETQLALAEAIRAKTGKSDTMTTEDMVTAVESIETTQTLIADEPTTPGEWACLARASQMRDIQYQVKATMPTSWEESIGTGFLNPNYPTTGLWYSSTRGTEWGFVGYAVSMYSLLTAINNHKSVIYKRTYADYFAADTEKNGACNTYGTNCSSYVSYCFGLPYLTTTGQLAKLDCMADETGQHNENGMFWDSANGICDAEALRGELKLCDILNGNGHVIMVTGIRRDADGIIQEVDISHSWWGLIRKETFTWDALVSKYIDPPAEENDTHKAKRNKAYRYGYLESVTFPDNLSDIVYSDLCTSRGDKISIRPDQDLALNIISKPGKYAGIVLLKDGAYHSHHEGATDWRLIDPNNQSYPLATGKYTAILYGEGDDPTAMTEADATDTNSTRFIVCAVSVERTAGDNYDSDHVSTYDYTAEAVNGVLPTPVQITLKNVTGMTKHVHLLSESGFDGAGKTEFEFTPSSDENQAPKIIHIPFRTEYGFVVAENGFDNLPLDKPILPDDGVDDPVTTYTVTFSVSGDGNMETPAAQTVTDGGLATEPTLSVPDGYTFNGWYTSADLATKFDFSTSITADVILYGALTANSAADGVELTYVTFPKGAYIDTGIKVADHDHYATDYYFHGSITEATGGAGYLFGVLDDDCRMANPQLMSSKNLCVYVGKSGSAYRGGTITIGTEFKLDITNAWPMSPTTAKVLIDGTECSWLAGSAYTADDNGMGDSEKTLKLFAADINTELRKQLGGRFKRFTWKVSDGSKTICDIVPWKKADGTIGVRDTVSGTFFGNVGSGTIEAGPEVSET